MQSNRRSIRWIVTGLALASLLAAAPATIAHEGHKHQVLGTVTMVHEDHLMLTTTDGEEKTFVLSEATKYVRGESETTKDDVTAGKRAAVTYETRDGADRALEIRLGEKRP